MDRRQNYMILPENGSVLALLEDGSHAQAAADAQGSQTLLGVGTLHHLVEQGDNDPGAGAADGVADGDGAAVDVDLCLLYTSPSPRD